MTATSDETLRVISPGGASARELLSTAKLRLARMLPMNASCRICSFSWSPHARRIALGLETTRQGRVRRSVWGVDVERSGRARQISPNRGDYYAPIWIDEDHVGAIRSQRGRLSAVALHVDGGPARLLCTVPTDDLDWSPDRSRIIASTNRPVPSDHATGLTTIETGL
jgi:hypothetical protein